MLQNILPIAGAELQSPQQGHHLGMYPWKVQVKDGLLSFLLDDIVHLTLHLGDNLFDPGRVNTTIGDELAHGLPSHLPADAVETGNDNDSRRIVDDDVNARGLFKGANITPFTANDTPLHLIVGNLDGAGCDVPTIARG